MPDRPQAGGASNSTLTDSPLWIRRIASASAGATDSTVSFSHRPARSVPAPAACASRPPHRQGAQVIDRVGVTVQPAPAPPLSSFPRRPVRVLATLGDSTPVGLGDPVPGPAWRGFAVLLRTALGPGALVNPAREGARAGGVRREQLAVAVAAVPDVAVVVVGMNDTLRSDFDPVALAADYRAVVDALHDVGAYVVLARYHDHTRVFRLPGPLRRALRLRIAALNAVIDAVVAADPVRTGLLDLDLLPGGYEREAWSVDRLHPSERGHRLLADGMAALLVGAGFEVVEPVALECSGGRTITAAHRAAWLLVRGVPWAVRRGRDLGPVVVQGLATGLLRR
jgi:lysophospholipase L1-like esterase